MMKYKFSSIALFISIFQTYSIESFLFSKENWNGLRIRWGINPFGGQDFVSLPRTEKDAMSQGWKKEKDCSQNVIGNRYILNGDRAVILIYNLAGNISGIASSLPKNLPFNYPSRSIQPYLDDEGVNGWTISAYFTDPNTICNRAAARQQITGDRLIILSRQRQLTIPLKESDIDKTYWFEGQCFPTMGKHYWRNERGLASGNLGNPEGEDFFPAFALYNNKKLNAFGWAFNANLTSPRYEHPTQQVFPLFFKQVPNFLKDKTKSDVQSTLHIFLDNTPIFNFC